MPTVRYQIRNEYGLADPEVYRAAEKDDPEALLEGVAMAGLVGVLRQLGDLAEFAAEVFHDLHEEVMATSSRGHGLLLRVQQLDAEFPLIEKAILSQIDHSHSAYNAGIEWHPNLRVEQNLVIQGDMPRFILDSYEECRGPPQLFMLDKFDVAGAGACLTRYSNPSFFKTESAPSEIMESELQREKRPRKNKQKGSCWRNGETTNSFFMPIMDYSQFLASEPVPEKFPSRLVKLKHRNLRVSDIRNRKSYMDCFINEQLEQTDPKISLSGSNINKSINWASETREIITDGVIDSSPFREEVITQSPKEVTTKFQNEKRKGKIFLEKTSTFSDVSENLNPYSQNTKEEEMLMELSNEVDIHDFDISSDENDMNTPPLQLAEHKNLLLDSGFISDVDHESYASDDIGSELENYVDALNTLETEVETDSESRCKSDPSFFNRQSQGLNCNINGHLELQPQSSGSDFIGSFDTPVHSRKEKDVMPLRKSSNLVDFPYQLQLRTIFEETSSTEIKINQGDAGKLEMDSECMEIVPSTCLSSNETCYQKQPNATMPVFVSRELERAVECMEIVPSASLSSNESFYQKQPNVTMLVSINRDEFSSSSISDSALKPNEDLKEAQLLGAHPVEDFSGSSKSTPQVTEQVESSFLPWKTNHTDVPSTFKPNATMFVPISRDAFSNSSTADSALKPNGDLKVAQSLCAHSVEDFSVISKTTPEFNEHVESSFLPGETNHVGVPSTFKEHPDELDDDNLLRCSEDRISATITDKDHMSYNSLKTDYIILLEKVFTECTIVSPLTMVDDDIGKPTQVHEPENKSDSIILKSHDTFIDMDVDMQSEYSAMKSTSDYLEAFDEDKISLSSNVLFPAETHELSLLVSDVRGSHESTQTSENVGDDVACIPDERGSYHEKQKNPMIGHFSGYTENTMSNDTANTFQMPESPPKSSVVVVSTDYVKHNEIYSVKNLSPDSSALSFEIVSSNLQPESLAGEIGNIFVTQDEFVHPQSPVSSKNVDIFGFDASTSPAISYELEQFPVSVQPQESVNLVILEPLLSGSGEDSYAAQLQLEEIELIETNEKKHVNDELEFTNGFTKLDPPRELLVGESKMVNKSLDGNVIIEDGIDGQVHMLESAKVSSFDLLLIENPHLEDDALYQPRPDDEEPAITRVSKLFPSENKSYFTLIQNEEQDMFMSSLSNQTSVLDLSNSIDTSFTDINVDDPHVKLCYSFKGDNMCLSKNKQDSDSISENAITEGDTDGKVLPMLQSSNLNSLDVQFQEDTVSENATLNRHMPEIENLDIASHDSASKNGIAEDGTYHQSLSLLKSSYTHSFDAHIEEVSVSEDASISQHKPDIEKTTITSDLTSLKFEREFFAPFSKNGDQEEPISAVSSSQSLARYSSNITNDTLSEHNFDDIILEFYPGEKGLICSSKNEQDSNLDALMQHFQSVPERPELQSEQASVSELSTILLHEKINMELPDKHLDEDCSDEHTLNHYSSEHEVLFTEPEIEVFINNRSNNELSMPPEKAHVTEKIETYPSVPFQDVSEHPASSMISEDFASKSLVADFISPISITSTVEPLRALPGETISSLSLLKGIDETPPLPPLPPIQWRMGKPPQGNLISDVYAAQPVIETNPFIFPLNTHMYQHAGPFMFHTALEEKFQHVSPCTDAQLTESSNLSEFPQNKLDKIQQFEIHFPEIETVHSSGISSIISDKEEGNHAHGYFASVGEDPFTLEERRPKLAKLLPGLELERSQEASIVETDGIPSFNPFMFMPTTGDGMYQFDYGNYGGYKGENLQHHSLSGSLPVAAHGFPHYNYHMFLREGNSSTMYDIMLPKMEGENQNGKQRSIRNRQRDPLIEAVAAHDKSTLRKVSELDRPLTKSKEDEQNYLLEQIKHKSLLLKPATSTKANMLKAPSTNLKVAAILQKANAIRQACAGSDEDDDDNWN